MLLKPSYLPEAYGVPLTLNGFQPRQFMKWSPFLAPESPKSTFLKSINVLFGSETGQKCARFIKAVKALMLSENTSLIVKQCFTLGVIRTVAFNILPIESLDSLPSGAEWNWWPESLAVNLLRISLVVKENKCGTDKPISLICWVVVLWSWFFWKQPLSSCLQQGLYRDSVMTITTFHM